MKSKTNIYDEIREAAAKKAKEADALRKSLANAESDKAKAEQTADEAITTGNASLYTDAKSAARTADDQIEFYRIQLDKLKSAPLFADDKAKAEELKHKMTEYQSEKLKSIASMLKQVSKELNDINDEYNTAESVGKLLDSNFSMLNERVIFNTFHKSASAPMKHALVKDYINQ